MNKSKTKETLIAIETKFSKKDDEPTVGSNLYKRFVGSLMYLIVTIYKAIYAISYTSRLKKSTKDSH